MSKLMCWMNANNFTLNYDLILLCMASIVGVVLLISFYSLIKLSRNYLFVAKKNFILKISIVLCIFPFPISLSPRISIFLSLCFYNPVYLFFSMSLCISVSMFLYHYLSLCLSVLSSLCPIVCLSLSYYTPLSFSVYLCLTVSLFIYFYASIPLSFSQSVYLFVLLSHCFYTPQW